VVQPGSLAAADAPIIRPRYEQMRRLGGAGLPNVEQQLKAVRQAAPLSRLHPFQSHSVHQRRGFHPT